MLFSRVFHESDFVRERQSQHLRTMIHGGDRRNPMRGPRAQYKPHLIQAQGVVNVTGGLKMPAMNRIEGSTEDPDYLQTATPFNASSSRHISVSNYLRI